MDAIDVGIGAVVLLAVGGAVAASRIPREASAELLSFARGAGYAHGRHRGNGNDNPFADGTLAWEAWREGHRAGLADEAKNWRAGRS